MATLKAVIKNGNRRKDGTWNIVIRLTHKSTKRFIPTSIPEFGIKDALKVGNLAISLVPLIL